MDDKPSTAGSVNLDEKAKQIAGDKPQHNMFAKEVIITEKEKMRQRLVTEKDAMKEVCFVFWRVVLVVFVFSCF